MTDFKKRKALNFKLIVDHESGSVDFIPDLLPGRDDEVIESMENAIRGHIKFEYDLIQTFFKRVSSCLTGRYDLVECWISLTDEFYPILSFLIAMEGAEWP